MYKTLTNLTFLFFLIHLPVFSQSKFTISGYVEDTTSAEKLIQAVIFDKKNNAGVVSNT
jgi:hypothetical protein